MAHGFLAINGNNQVLVSSETRNLHFVGKALLKRTIEQFNNYGGLRHWAYQIACNVTPVPFFTMPVDAYYAVAAVRQVASGVWEIEIIRSGTSELAPEVYVFSDPRGATGNGGTNYGMLVMRDDGTPSFDSRLNPLAVTGGAMVSPPQSPINALWNIVPFQNSIIGITEYNYWNPGDYEAWRYGTDYSKRFANINYRFLFKDRASGDASSILTPTNSNSNEIYMTSKLKPIFFFPSLAMCTRIVSDDYFPNAYYRCISNYWSMYRSAISFYGNIIKCGWVCIGNSAYWQAKRIDSGFSFGSVDTTSIVGAGSGGYPPYVNESLNIIPTAVIVGEGIRYD